MAAIESPSRTILVLPIGSHVRVAGPDGFDGRIMAVSVRGDYHVTYEVVWWDGRDRKAEWLEPTELSLQLHSPDKIGIGFLGAT